MTIVCSEILGDMLALLVASWLAGYQCWVKDTAVTSRHALSSLFAPQIPDPSYRQSQQQTTTTTPTRPAKARVTGII